MKKCKGCKWYCYSNIAGVSTDFCSNPKFGRDLDGHCATMECINTKNDFEPIAKRKRRWYLLWKR